MRFLQAPQRKLLYRKQPLDTRGGNEVGARVCNWLQRNGNKVVFRNDAAILARCQKTYQVLITASQKCLEIIHVRIDLRRETEIILKDQNMFELAGLGPA